MLVKNGFMIATVWAESIPTWATASNALILELKQGEQVGVCVCVCVCEGEGVFPNKKQLMKKLPLIY